MLVSNYGIKVGTEIICMPLSELFGEDLLEGVVRVLGAIRIKEDVGRRRRRPARALISRDAADTNRIPAAAVVCCTSRRISNAPASALLACVLCGTQYYSS